MDQIRGKYFLAGLCSENEHVHSAGLMSDVILLQFTVERSPGDIQYLGRLSHVVVGVFQDVKDVVLFQILQGGEFFPFYERNFFQRLEELLKILRKILNVDKILLGENRGAFQNVLQLPDISGPLVSLEELLNLSGYTLQLFRKFLASPLEEMPGERGDILRLQS